MKKIIFIVAAVFSIACYCFLPVWAAEAFGVESSANGVDAMFGDGARFFGAMAFLPLVASIATLVCEFVCEKYAKFVAILMVIAGLWMLTVSNLSPSLGAFLYILCAIACVAVPFINIPEKK